MCLLFMYLNDNPTPEEYRLIIADNRDEVYSRPTKPLSWSENGVYLCGRDLFPGKEGGTWLGVSKTGKIGVLLNVLGILDTTKQSRGHFITHFLSNKVSSQQLVEGSIKNNPDNFNPFHLILLDLSSPKSDSLSCDVSGKQVHLKSDLSGIFTCDNSTPGASWQKSEQNRDRFSDIVEKYNGTELKSQLVEELINLLKDKTRFPGDYQLRQQASLTNMAEDLILERSSAFVCSPKIGFGTRTHSVILVDYDGNCEFIEKTMKTPIDPDNVEWETNSFNFPFTSGNKL